MRRPLETLTLAALCFTAVMAAAGCKRRAAASDDDPEAAPISVVCATARSTTGSDSVTLRGVVAVPPERSALVSAAIPGRVTRLLVHEGDQVQAGQLLASIEDPALEASATEAAALTSAARSALTSADAAQARAQRLFDQGIAPRRDVEDAVARQASARAELQAAQARQLLARRQQGRTMRAVSAPQRAAPATPGQRACRPARRRWRRRPPTCRALPGFRAWLTG